MMVQQSHYYPAAQASDLGFLPLMNGFDALGASGSGNVRGKKKKSCVSGMSTSRYNKKK
jgi:hypothetical protein